jgi:hypothetical protein
MSRNSKTDRKSEPKSPAFIVYAVSDKGKGKSIWTRIGAAFAHEDGKGFNTSEFNVTPMPGARIVLRAVKDDKAPEGEAE